MGKYEKKKIYMKLRRFGLKPTLVQLLIAIVFLLTLCKRKKQIQKQQQQQQQQQQ